MAALRHLLAFMAAASLLPLGCTKPVGLGGAVTPLVQINVQTTDPNSVVPAGTQLHVALVWGLQWQPEPFCFLPSEWSEAANVVAAGCPDSFGFVPNLVGQDVALQPGSPATIALNSVPGADVLVGDLTGRIAYGSLVVYQDVNQNGVLDLRTPPRFRRHGDQTVSDDGGVGGPADLVYGASFVSMTQPDQRVSYLEAKFNGDSAFYPRWGCPDDPPAGFSILSAGGFLQGDSGFFQPDSGVLQADTLASLLTSKPFLLEDPSTCSVAPIDTVVTIELQDPANLTQLACTANQTGGATRYLEAPTTPPNTADRQCAFVDLPQIPGDDAGVVSGRQFVVSNPPGAACKYVIHYTLIGCNNDPKCTTGGWDLTGAPPPWWEGQPGQLSCSSTP
ncbi:MAG TPA: hypothetical protein VIM14_09400 [Polyangia bacterium]